MAREASQLKTSKVNSNRYLENLIFKNENKSSKGKFNSS